ncbi:MAG: GatB/YqeY domain-containing protein [Candidatus Lokiarchaeota archaeon]|nr:GatB/YqeY domain-containing protein [Candidatus Lokiarchaeota archaeon]
MITIFSENPAIIINVILEITTALRRDGKNMENIANSDFEDIFMELKRKEISKEAIEEILIMKADNPSLSIEEIKQKLKLEKMSVDQLKKVVEMVINNNLEIIESKEMRAMGPLMGEVMKEVRGKIDGEIVSKELKTAIQKRLEVLK